jgi:glyoxylase-like metal-dependent hydrolase (beta-lactamase superfamily II)
VLLRERRSSNDDDDLDASLPFFTLEGTAVVEDCDEEEEEVVIVRTPGHSPGSIRARTSVPI